MSGAELKFIHHTTILRSKQLLMTWVCKNKIIYQTVRFLLYTVYKNILFLPDFRGCAKN